MHDRQTHSKHLARLEQVADIGAAVALADRAVAFRVDWGIVQLIFCVVDVDDALPGEQVAVARIAAGHDAVEQVDAAVDRLDNVDRCANPHQVARLVLGHIGFNLLDDVVHHRRRLAHRQTADGVAVAVDLRNLLHVLDAQIVKGGALVDAEQHLVRVDGVRQRV